MCEYAYRYCKNVSRLTFLQLGPPSGNSSLCTPGSRLLGSQISVSAHQAARPKGRLFCCKSVELLISLNVPSLPSMHWRNNAGWEVCIALAGGRVRCMYMYIET